MKTLVKKVRKACYLDNKEFFDSNRIKMLGLLVEDEDYTSTRLYKAVKNETDARIRQLVLICLIGREFGSLHGSNRCGFSVSEYLEYFNEQRQAMGLKRSDDLSFLLRNRLDLLSYIDRLVKLGHLVL